MHQDGWPANERAMWLAPALFGWLVGTAVQLQQPALWPVAVYVVLVPAALGFGVLAAYLRGAASSRRWRGALASAGILLAGAALALGVNGWRSAIFVQTALAPALEGADLQVTGLVAAMPQRNDGGLRFRLDVESAARDGRPVALPPRLELHWYRGSIAFEVGNGTQAELQRAPPDVRAGQRWQMTVRLKAPHGGRNPHGFDYELWLWEQGVQATGYVRAGPNDPAPVSLGDGWRHPIERGRQAVRDAIYARMAPPGLQGDDARQHMRLAGVVAALVVGDQNAIDVFG